MRESEKLNSQFLKLLDPVPPDSSLLSEIENPGEIVHKAIKHNVHMTLYAGLLRYRDDISSGGGLDALFNELKGLYFQNLPRAVRQEFVQSEILASLHKEKIPAVIFRGNAIAKALYDTPYCRTASDIDMLIRLADAFDVDSILLQKGYNRNDSLPLNFWFSRLHHAVYRHAADNALIEMHWNFSIPSFFNLSSEEIWDEVISPGPPEAELTPGMSVIMLLMHHHMHAFRELKILVDILWAFRKYEDTINWGQLAEKITKTGLVKTTLLTIHQIRNLWPESAKNIAPIRILEQNIQKLSNKRTGLLLYFIKPDIDKKNTYRPVKDKLINRLSLDSRSAFIRSFVKTLLPLPETVKALYDVKQSWTLPLLYIRFITWRIRCWIGL